MQQMDLWDGGKWSALVDNTKAGVLGRAGQNWLKLHNDTAAHSYNACVLSIHLQSGETTLLLQ